MKSAFTTLVGDSLSTSCDGLFWDEVCSTFSDPLFASKLHEDDLGDQEGYEELKLVNRRLLVDREQLAKHTRDLQAQNQTLTNRVAFSENEVTRLASALQGLTEENKNYEPKLQDKDEMIEELQRENKRYKQELQDKDEAIRILTQRNPVEEEASVYSGQYSPTPEDQTRYIQAYHPFDELWQLD
jgi:chromosome segregation ATPase